jgi:hypothetical protein
MVASDFWLGSSLVWAGFGAVVITLCPLVCFDVHLYVGIKGQFSIGFL